MLGDPIVIENPSYCQYATYLYLRLAHIINIKYCRNLYWILRLFFYCMLRSLNRTFIIKIFRWIFTNWNPPNYRFWIIIPPTYWYELFRNNPKKNEITKLLQLKFFDGFSHNETLPTVTFSLSSFSLIDMNSSKRSLKTEQHSTLHNTRTPSNSSYGCDRHLTFRTRLPHCQSRSPFSVRIQNGRSTIF